MSCSAEVSRLHEGERLVGRELVAVAGDKLAHIAEEVWGVVLRRDGALKREVFERRRTERMLSP